MKHTLPLLTLILLIIAGLVYAQQPKSYTVTITAQERQAIDASLADISKAIVESDIPMKTGVDALNKIDGIRMFLNGQYARQDSLKGGAK